MPPILKRGMQPADFLQLRLGLLIILTLIMVWKDPIRIKENMRPETVGTIALFAVFAALAMIDLFLALGVFAAALAAFWRERRLLTLALIGIGVPLGIFFMLDLGFEIPFPRGLLTNIWYVWAMDALVNGVVSLSDPYLLLLLIRATIRGVFIGALPGLNATTGAA